MVKIKRFLPLIDNQTSDLHHSTYFGDLLAPVCSEFNRNRNVGMLIGRGDALVNDTNRINIKSEGDLAVKGIYTISK